MAATPPPNGRAFTPDEAQRSEPRDRLALANNSPWSARVPSSPKQADYPKYVESGENARGVHAIESFGTKDFTVASLIAAACDSISRRLPS
jgi:acyl-homoserine-lactone acylase